MAKNKKRQFEFVASSSNGVLDIAVSEDINISIRDSKALYVTIGDWVYYQNLKQKTINYGKV